MRTLRLLTIAVLFAACAGQPDSQVCKTGITCPEGTKCAAVQAICITNDCGDGITQGTERCDDGNIQDGDGCAANCGSLEACGDGVLNAAAGELCDDGNTTGGDGCAADCISVEICGNGTRDVNEVCDDGNTLPGDGCSGNCLSTEVCGNSIVDVGEKCDDGTTPGGCNPDCQGGTGCGDGAIDRDGLGNALEECDDGNTDNFDDCTNQCNLNVCGDGIVQATGARTEGCDPAVNFVETAGCNLDCTVASCGDNKINNIAGEECDDGAAMNANSRDCTASCKVNVCGDSLPNTMGPAHIEQCDDGFSTTIDNCSNQCTMPTCGNGVREGTEACDDFNLNNGDGCSSLCVNERCGDGLINDGEQCDGTGTTSVAGTPGETTTCNVNCTTRSCGDGIVNKTAGEECDDQNSNDEGATDFCRNTTCKLNFCGDGKLGVGEACDDGNTVNTDTCNNDCALQSCGDGIRQGSEPCDDGNNVDTDSCRNTCVLPFCGDGVVRTTGPSAEECDNGANNGPNNNCLATCKNNVCGDGFRDTEGMNASDTDECDDGNTNDEMACPYGINSCTACSGNCNTVLNLTGAFCGDGAVNNASETCDDNNNVTETECAYGAVGGTCDICNASCQIVAETGPYCGDRTTSNGETCDDGSPTCGLCNSSCSGTITATAATGIIIVDGGGNGATDGKLLTIDDGNGTSITIEFDTNGMGVVAPRIALNYANTEDATEVRESLQSIINGAAGLDITATDLGAAGLLLTNTNIGVIGNVAITNTVNDATKLFVSGMSGGTGRDCAIGNFCTSDDDCASGDCDLTGSPTFKCQ